MTVELPVLPAHWGKSRVDRVASVNARIGWKALTAAEYQPQGFTFLSTPNIKGREIDFENVNYITEFRYRESPELKLREGDVLLVKDGNTLGIVNLVKYLPRPATVNGSIAVIRPTGIDGAFLRYVLESRVTQAAINMLKGGMGVPHLFQWDINRLPIPVPPLEEQRRIADFLDTETARIDRLVAARDAQLSALEERELAVIGHMLSGGATSQGGRSTDWPWLPYIPANWSIGPVYAYYFTDLGKMLNPERASGEKLHPYLRNANVHWYEINTADMASMHFEADEVRRYSVAPGDLLVCEGGAGVAEAAVWDGRIEECYFQKSLHRVRQSSEVPVEWLMYWLRFAKACGVFDASGNIATIPHLTGEQLRQYRIPIPRDGQRLIRETNQKIGNINDARTLLNAAQKRLSERRQALITAAVTGQFDVSTASGRNVTDGVTA